MNNDTLRSYKNKVVLKFSKRGDDFTLDVPHYNKWVSIIRFLKKRGFDVKENKAYKEHYDVLSKYHKIGLKKDVAVLMEISADSIYIEFGNIQNLWKEMAQSFWSDPKDDRFTKLSYLESVAVNLEIKKLLQYCERYNLTKKIEDDNLSPEEYIIKKLKINKHIHGEVNCLNDIKNSITQDSYNWEHNSDDRDNKKIVCGETKYFYDYYNKRLACGIVWHNINNMWWVICGNKLRNIASYNLFDYEKSLPRRTPADDSDIDRLLRKYESKKDYKRCMNIQNFYKLQTESVS